MSLPKRFNPRTVEPRLQDLWQEQGTFHLLPQDEGQVYAIDTPPPTVSGKLHLGHVYSYSHADFLARFWRMRGRNVLYPMGFDDNGLPTERLVERSENIRAAEVGRKQFIEACLEVSEKAEREYETLWRRLGLSIDWRYTYRTIDEKTRRLSQLSFIDLYQKGLAYRRKAPTIWCPECQRAIAQAELNDLERESEYITIEFKMEDGPALPIATTRPELLPACVALFVHPEDPRYKHIVGGRAQVPLFERRVPIKSDPEADPDKGTGIVMCCTFGDTTDVNWWYAHDLELIEVIDKKGSLSEAAAEYAGLSVSEARSQIKQDLEERHLIIGREPSQQSVRVHERCDTPVEYIVTAQWFIRVLEFKNQLVRAGEQVEWHPEHMQSRYIQWVENLGWDWCISRQRYFGVTFPVWYCSDCGELVLAEKEQLPIDPSESQHQLPCTCGSHKFTPELDVMDTWATSSLSPQLVANWLDNSGFDGQTFKPVWLRTQAHEIIRTWAFYSLVKSYHHFGKPPWKIAAISGWGLAPEGSDKLSKSRGGGIVSPMEMIANYSADAIRYWAASTGLGKDTVISEEKIQAGMKLVNKLWNVGRFSQRFLADYQPADRLPELAVADRWILSRLNSLIERVTSQLEKYDYAGAKSQIELFFWNDLADNYLEMAKKRLYEDHQASEGARYTLDRLLLTTVKLLAPYLPHVTEVIYQKLFAEREGFSSLHRSTWPEPDDKLIDDDAEAAGDKIVQIATAVRRFKSARNLSLATYLSDLYLITSNPNISALLEEAQVDIIGITRANRVTLTKEPVQDSEFILLEEEFQVAVRL